jgi:long-chain acyl-CoA synthetase
MSYLKNTSYNGIIAESIRKYWENDSLTDYGIQTYKYKDVARQIENLHIIFENAGIKPGDKIALCGRNMSNWGISFFSVITYGAVAVPILHEFHPTQVHDIVNHSEAKMLFVGDNVWKTLNADEMPALEGIICIKDFELLVSRSEKLSYACENINLLFGQKYPQNFLPEHVNYHKDQPEELAIINYTSGTTSNSKGVMIPYRALWSNADFGFTVLADRVQPGDKILSMLPMAHMYGMAFEFVFEFMYGIHVNFLTKMASPTILLKALAEVKPCVIVLVPLIIEKIVRKAVLPKLQDPKVRLLMKMPVIGQHIRKKICDGLTQALGGNFFEVIIGGAALNQEIETLLHDIGFRYCIGYGATECAPIISYENWFDQVPGSCGKAVVHMEVKIDSPDPEHKEGEILARGMNVMLGYFKNPEATEQVLDKDGWYHTGDMGIMDAQGNIFIKGRCKNMLLGANGQNIYPEEIEDKLSNMTMVMECVVIQKGEKLYGLVYPDQEKITKLGLQPDDLVTIMEQNRKELNPTLPNYAQLSGIKIMDQEFEKTPKKSIKRFKYMDVEI